MTAPDLTSLRAYYASLSDVALAEAYRVGADGYQPGAWGVITAEYERRGGAALAERADRLAQDEPSPRLFKPETFTERSNRWSGHWAATRRQSPSRNIVVGGLWLLGGLLVTGISYSQAAPGGTYVVTGGALVYGTILLLQGIFRGLFGSPSPGPVSAPTTSATDAGAPSAHREPTTPPPN